MAIIAVGALVRFVLAPRDAVRDVREFVCLHSIRTGMRSPVTAPLVLLGLTALVGIFCWGVGALVQFEPLEGIGFALWIIALPIAFGYVCLLLVISMLIEIFRPLRRKK